MNSKINKLTEIDKVMDNFKDGCSLMYGGFGGVGTSPMLIEKIFNKNIKNLTIIGNDAGSPVIGIGRLICNKQVKKMITTHIGLNPVAGNLMNEGEMEIEFSPQGTLAERIRAGGVGLGGILIDVGIGTLVEKNKEIVEISGKQYLIEKPLRADIGIIYAKKADTFGNLIYDKSARNFNPLVAMATDYTVVHAEEVVEAGELDPEIIVTPGIYIDAVVTGNGGEWEWFWE